MILLYASFKRQLLARRSLLYKMFSKLSPEPCADPILLSKSPGKHVARETLCSPQNPPIWTSLRGSRTWRWYQTPAGHAQQGFISTPHMAVRGKPWCGGRPWYGCKSQHGCCSCNNHSLFPQAGVLLCHHYIADSMVVVSNPDMLCWTPVPPGLKWYGFRCFFSPQKGSQTSCCVMHFDFNIGVSKLFPSSCGCLGF